MAALAACAAIGCSQNNGETVKPTSALQGLTDTPHIEARDYSFIPDEIQAPPGQVTLTLNNGGSQKHAFELYTDEQYQDPVQNAKIDAVEPGGSESVTFDLPDKKATYYFRCEIHPQRMHGQIEIGGGG